MNKGFKKIYFALFLFLFSLSNGSMAQDQNSLDLGGAFQVSIDIKHANELVSQPTVLLIVGRQAELSWTDVDGVLENFKLNLLAEEIDSSTIKMTAQVFERVDGKQVLQTSPQILMAHDSEVTFNSSFKSGSSENIAIDFIVNKVAVDSNGNFQDCSNSSIKEIDGLQEKQLNCPVDLPLLNADLIGDGDSIRSGGNCCQVNCGNVTLTCCGAIGCCDAQCGACCRRQ